ncbi:MAG: hypothetical protein ACNYPG_03325 [Candidatus Porifericomitaceae bacterium WSBS_2022_MAG_OTU9]
MRTIFMTLALASLAACAAIAPSHKGDTYSRDELGSHITVQKGTVLATRIVQVDGTDHKIGAISGAVVGGALGAGVGGNDSVSIAVGVAGAVIGGVLGNMAERELTKGEALEVIVRHDGEERAIAIVQDGQEVFQIGQKVLVLYGSRIRITNDPDA